METLKKIAYVVGPIAFVGLALSLSQQAYLQAALFVAIFVSVIVTVRHHLRPYEEVARAVERLAAGDLSQPRLTVTESSSDAGRLATSVNQLLTQLRLLSEEATELASGLIGVQHLQDKVLQTGQLSAVDLPTSASQGDLNRSFAELTNQLRRLTVKSHIIANDQLFNPALDEELPGELGEAFGTMVHNLRTLAGRAEQIAGGDLRCRVDGDGDLARTFNEMVASLRELVEEIISSALHVASSTEEMLQVLHQHEESARRQADRIRQAQQTVERLFTSSDSIAGSARQVFRAAEDASEKNRQIAWRIKELNQHSERIAEILKLIQSIADRSDLLAINASLEGARAGETGRGFTLVAKEMRRLAENTKESVGEIKEIVSDIQLSARTTSEACQEGVERSEDTTEAAENIKVVTLTQRENTGEVTRAMDELAGMVTQGVCGIRQVTVAAAELADLSQSLRRTVQRFEVDEHDGTDFDQELLYSTPASSVTMTPQLLLQRE